MMSRSACAGCAAYSERKNHGTASVAMNAWKMSARGITTATEGMWGRVAEEWKSRGARR